MARVTMRVILLLNKFIYQINMYTCYKYFLNLAVLVMLLAAVVSCQEDDSLGERYSQTSGDVTELCFISDPMQKYNVVTRSSDAKEDAEKRIYSINIFFFTSDGDYLEGKYLTGNPNAPDKGGYYKTGEGVALLKIAPDYIDENQGEVTVYAVANVDNLFATGDDGRPLIISQIMEENPSFTAKQALESIVYRPQWDDQVSLGLPEGGMPMAGSKGIIFKGNNVTPEADRVIELKALMARVDINLQVSSTHGSAKYPSFLLTEWSVKNVPDRVAITSSTSEETGSEWGEDWVKNSVPQKETSTYTNGEGLKNVCTFYVFENMQNAEWIKDEGEHWANTSLSVGQEGTESDLYPANISDAQKQRYKPYLANKYATAVELKGVYHTYNDQGSSTSSVYNVSYTLYLGGNYTNNFQLKRNHQYKNNITIKGLLGMDGTDGEYTFDARVNVDEEENDFYVSILRERNHDAHFCITPMDVYMFRELERKEVEMDITLSEVDEEGNPTNKWPDWIQMERISADDMAVGTVSSSGFTAYNEGSNTGTHLATGIPWSAGNGKRAFFTTSLMSELKDNLAKNGNMLKLTKHRDRVYFYLDENLNSSTVPLTNPRQAMVIMVYKEKAETGEFVEKGRKTIMLAQYPFLEVQVYGRGDDNGNDTNKRNLNLKYPNNEEVDDIYGVGDGVIYMEQIEEYLEHYDPLDKYNTGQIYDGLPWGEKQELDLGSHDQYDWRWDRWNKKWEHTDVSMYPWKNYVLGLYYTRRIIDGYAQGRMTLNTPPRSAAEYCWNRNKRADVGAGSNYGIVQENTEKYFLPGIRQMEDALTTYYNQFTEFQGNYYWSSSVSWSEGIFGLQSEDKNKARATKVNMDGTYAESSPDDANNYPKGGSAGRDQKLRIRVFRSDLE